MMVNFIAFYLAQWEEFHTGTLELGIANVTEVQILGMIVHLTTFFFGPSFWLTPIDLNIFKNHININYATLLYIAQGLGAAGTLAGNLIKISNLTMKSDSKLDRSQVWSHLIPAFVIVLFSGLWAYYSETSLLQTHPNVFLIAIGNLFSYLVGRMVLARVTMEKFNPYQPIILPLILAFINTIMGQVIMSEVYFMYLLLILFTLVYLHFALSVIDELTTHLKIRCLTIPHKKE